MLGYYTKILDRIERTLSMPGPLLAATEQAGQISNFSGYTQRRGFEEQRHDYTTDELPADNLQVRGGGMGQPQHPGGEFLDG